MRNKTRLLSSSNDAAGEIAPSNNYGSIQSQSESSQVEPIDDSKTTLKFLEKIGFSLGHIYNDLCAAIWFSYTLLFMQGVLGLAAVQAGALVMLGQVGDAVATPLVGMMTDRYGTKRIWHIVGTILVFLTFPLIFAVCPFCDEFPVSWKLTYLSIVILIFQFGWPVVQITHLAMIPELSRTQRDRSDLTATRYSASICSNVVVYIVTWAVLHIQRSYENKITPSDSVKFRDISLILTLIGASMSVLFHFSISFSNYEYRRRLAMSHSQPQPNANEQEPLIRNQSADSPSTSQTGEVEVVIRKNFFKTPLLYQNALLYVFSRLFMTTSLVYMPLWLNERSYVPTPPSNASLIPIIGDENSLTDIATVPLASFIASFIASMLFKQTNNFIGHKIGYLIGSFLSFCGCAWVALTSAPSTLELYMIATLFGSGSSITMIASLCITADMIGAHADQGGFIYSAVTFCDKLITGVAVVVIESIKCANRDDCPLYYRNVLAYACGVPAVLGALCLLSLLCIKSRNFISERNY